MCPRCNPRVNCNREIQTLWSQTINTRKRSIPQTQEISQCYAKRTGYQNRNVHQSDKGQIPGKKDGKKEESKASAVSERVKT